MLRCSQWCPEVEMERVSASANNPQKFYIRIGIRICGCCKWNLRIDIRTRTMQRRIIEYLVYTIQNGSDFLQKKQKSYFWKKTYLSLTSNINYHN